jgi:hypothetical protein
VTDWEPLELSAVPIPADPGAQFRSHDADGGATNDAEWHEVDAYIEALDPIIAEEAERSARAVQTRCAALLTSLRMSTRQVGEGDLSAVIDALERHHRKLMHRPPTMVELAERRFGGIENVPAELLKACRAIDDDTDEPDEPDEPDGREPPGISHTSIQHRIGGGYR